MRQPILNPKRDLKGATPNKLARALLRSVSSARSESVVSNKVSVKKVATDKTGNRVTHLSKRS